MNSDCHFGHFLQFADTLQVFKVNGQGHVAATSGVDVS